MLAARQQDPEALPISADRTRPRCQIEPNSWGRQRGLSADTVTADTGQDDYYSGKKDRHQRVTTEHAARPSRNHGG